MIKLSAEHDIFIPDEIALDAAVARTTHLGIGAHQDDLEFMAFHGIAECFRSETEWFGGIICTDGSGCSRSGPYAGYSDAGMIAIRRKEQKLAAGIGRYSFVAQLNYASKALTRPLGAPIVSDLRELITSAQPEIIYTHSPADKHASHIRVLIAVLAALQDIPEKDRPSRLYGCEMWRSLDWMDDDDKTIMDLSGHGHLAAALNGVFDSQIAGGKSYHHAVAGRRKANATLLDANQGDALDDASFAMDLSPLIGSDPADVVAFTMEYLDRFRDNVENGLTQTLGGKSAPDPTEKS